MSRSAFVLFGEQHLAALAVIAGACAATAVATRRGAAPQRPWIGRAIGLLIVAFVAETYLRRAASRPLHAAGDLPLEVCDIVLAAAAAFCLAPWTAGFELAYYWGLAGTLQALITPDLVHGFPSPAWIEFFWGHGVVMVALAYGIACGMRPRPGGPRRAFLALNVYLLMVGALDWLAGWNYGYLCHRPHASSLLDLLGPWPWYLVGAEGVAAVSFLLLDLPWRMRRGGGFRGM